jgi:hypothetical protein
MKNIAVISLRLLSIWAFLKAVIYTQYLPSFYLLEHDFLTAAGLGIFTTFLLYLVFSIILYFKAPLFASKITEGFGDQPFESVDYQKLAAVLFSSAGVLIFFWAIESFIQAIGSINHYRIIDPQNPDRFWVEVKLLLAGGGIQMIIGVYMFIGGKKLASWWVKFRDWT